MPFPIPRRRCGRHLSLASPAWLGFPLGPQGRPPHRHFRGLIGSSLALRPAASRNHLKVILFIEGSDNFVSSIAASIATGQSDHSQAGLPPAEPNKFHDARTRLVQTSAANKKISLLHNCKWHGCLRPVRRPGSPKSVHNFLDPRSSFCADTELMYPSQAPP